MAPKLLDFLPVFDAVLPRDWVLIGRCRVGGDAAGGCFVLAHPDVGVALVDLLPMRTRQAEALLRRLLNAVDFSALCPGYLPVIHIELGPDELPDLRARLEDGFGYDSVLTIGGQGRWVEVLRRKLQAGVTWEALSRCAPDREAEEDRPWRLPGAARLARGLVRAGLLGCGIAGVFGLGFASALLLQPVAPEVRRGGPAASTEAALAVARPPPPVVMEQMRPASLGAAIGHPLPADIPEPVAAESAAAQPVADSRTASLAPTVRRPARLPLPIDRRCSEAVFRFQQGASLSSQEMAHVRQGCASMR